MQALIAPRFARRSERLTSSMIRELLKLTQRPNLISFAGGLPAPELFPKERLRAASQLVLAERGELALQYAPTEGYVPLRELIVRRAQVASVAATIDNVLITSGAQQALDLVAKLFIDTDDEVVVEAPTYLGMIQAFTLFGARFAGIPTDDDGILPEPLADALDRGPKLMYLMPNFQNPTGVSYSQARRERVLDLAAQAGVPIVEDDPYGDLGFMGQRRPTLLALDPVRRAGTGVPFARGNVLYLGSFSKTLAPGLRLGWIMAPVDWINKLVQIKQAADLQTGTFTQHLAYEVARDGFLETHIDQIRAVYGQRRDVMLAALRANFDETVTWTEPEGGLFLWLKLPPGADSRALLDAALDRDVAFVPGAAFFTPDVPEADARRYLRLNYSTMTPERIEEGIARLAQAWRAF